MLTFAIHIIYMYLLNKGLAFDELFQKNRMKESIEKLEMIGEKFHEVKTFLNDHGPLLDKLSKDHRDFTNFTGSYRAKEDILFIIEEDLDLMLSNISGSNEENNTFFNEHENLQKSQNMLRNIIANHDYNIINLNLEQTGYTSVSNLTFISDNLKEVSLDIERVCDNLSKFIKYSSKRNASLIKFNQGLLSMTEKLIDNFKPIRNDICTNYQATRNALSRFSEAYKEVDIINKSIKEFRKELEYFIDNFNKNP